MSLQSHRCITWQDVQIVANELARKLNGEHYDVVIGINRGGLIPARLIAELIDVKNIDIIDMKMFVKEIFDRFEKYERILIVDDINDTGETFMKIRGMLEDNKMNNPKLIRVASLFKRYNSKFENSLEGEIVTDNKWLIFPWEMDIVQVKGIRC